MRLRLGIAVLLAAGAAGCATTQGPPPHEGHTPRAWRLLWQDEFDGDRIDPGSWSHQVFPGIDSGNRELQHYTNRPENSRVENGRLVIEAHREDYLGHAYTSARLHTVGKMDFTYGRVEASVRIPSTPGIWPAIWMMPSRSEYGRWPLSGEIDILESVNDADEIYGTIHYGRPQHAHSGTPYKPVDAQGQPLDLVNDFHVYAIEWDPTEIRWYFDGVHYGTQTEWMTPGHDFPAPFDRDFHLIANVAVGGNWPGPPNESSVFPQRMEIDWIRVYQSGGQGPTIREVRADSSVPARTPFVVEVSADDPDGDIAFAELWDFDTRLARAEEPPFTLRCEGLEDGCRELKVVVADAGGLRTRATLPLKVGEGCPRKPFGGEPIALPALVEAEHFDEGVDGEAYRDADGANHGGKARPRTGVDIGASLDGKTLSVGWTEPGEWLSYAIAPADAPRRFAVRVRTASANAAGGRFAIRAGDSAIEAAPAPTGDWHAFAETEAGVLEVPAGCAQLRVEVLEGGFNLDWIELAPAKD